MKIVGVYTDHFEAAVVQGRLRDAGIEACLLNEYTAGYVPWGTAMDRAVRVAVGDEDYQRTMEVLTPDAQRAEGKVCPLCGSANVVFGLRGRRRWGKILLGVLAAITMSPPGALSCNYFCKDCRQEF